MGIFDRLKRGKQTSEEECSGVVSNAKKNSMTAVGYAKSFQKNFDFSAKSIGELEEILDYYYEYRIQDHILAVWKVYQVRFQDDIVTGTSILVADW